MFFEIRHKDSRYFLPSADEWHKAAYFDPNSGVYYRYPTGSDTAPAPVASGTAANTAVYNQSSAAGPADITQAGGLSPYGTMGQGGSVWEWEETEWDLVNDSSLSDRGFRGGPWDEDLLALTASDRLSTAPTVIGDIGFRVASIPEPSSAAFGMLTITGLVARRRR